MAFAWRAASLSAALAITGLAALFAARGAESVADVDLGTEAAFAAPGGLHARENIPRVGSLRWTGPRATFLFDRLPPGAVEISARVRGHRAPVRIAANGVLAGEVPPGAEEFSGRVSTGGTRLSLELNVEAFEAGGRSLGTQVVRVTARPSRDDPSVALVVAILAVTAVAWTFAGRSATGPFGGAVVATAAGLALLALVGPLGLWRSGALFSQGAGVVILAGFAAFVARHSQGDAAARTALCVALLIGGALHGLVPASDLVVQGDAQFHANRLADVAGGNLFITSRTQHDPPFRFPYGFSFYALLAPFSLMGFDRVDLVRCGAAAASTASLFAFGWILGRRSAALAACAVAAWVVLPVNVRIVSFGNLSNVFAQAMLLLALAAAATLPRPALAVAVLSFLSGTAHLSGFVVVATLALCALTPRIASADERTSAAARGLGIGAIAALLYYAAFARLALDQAPRLFGERGGSAGAFDPLRLPGQILHELSWPIALLIVFGWFTKHWTGILPLAQAQLKAGLVLAAVAQVSPLEVRYFLALAPILTVVAASAGIGVGSGRSGLAWILGLAALAFGLRLWLEVSPVWSRLAGG